MNHQQRNYGVKLFKLLANATRLEIIDTLSREESLSVGTLTEKLGYSQAAISTQLARMRREGFISARQDGVNMYYSLKDKNLPAALKLLRV